MKNFVACILEDKTPLVSVRRGKGFSSVIGYFQVHANGNSGGFSS